MWNGFDFVCVCVYQYRFNLKEIIVFIPIVKNNAHVQLADMESREKSDMAKCTKAKNINIFVHKSIICLKGYVKNDEIRKCAIQLKFMTS